ncbi:MAG: HAMP domain-containing sensor histidine kinase, partial [Acidobacteriota bacterium]
PGQEELAKKLNGALDTLERTAELDRGVLLGQDIPELDWSRLSTVNHENLCFELLLREGFTGLEWLPGTREVSLTALSRRENGPPQLHLVSIGGGLADPFALQGWSTDLPALTARIRALDARHRLLAEDGKLALHLLFLWSPREGSGDQIPVDNDLLRELAQRLAGIAGELGGQASLHLKAWHRHRIENQIGRWPMLVRHYFARDPSAEPVDRRKTAEDLYHDAARLGQKAAEASGQLEQKYGLDPGFEWQRRAYTVTHSIGNAIFPVETYLDFLHERMREAGDAESEELARRSMESIEKAKIHIFKFKNIARFKKPRLQAIDIVPRLDMSLAAASHSGIRVERYIGEHPKVDTDPDLFDELMDEIVANSISWLEKADEKRIEVVIKPAGTDDLPPRLSRVEREFLWLRFADSGPGVRHELKEKIFELFFSTNPQGMGFGLAIVRKNLRDFGGDIVETGMPGQGICFDIFLPISA